MLLRRHGERAKLSSGADFARKTRYIAKITTPMLPSQSSGSFPKSLLVKEQFILLRQQPMHGGVALANREFFLVRRQREPCLRREARRFERQHPDKPVVNARIRRAMNSRN